jgi:hypothetical protein
MAALLTLAQIREHVETDLSNDALQRLIDSEDAEIVQRFGALSTQTEIFKGGSERLFLSRLVSSITSISEEVGETTTTLAADDYELWWSQELDRDPDGTNGRSTWGERVTVVYVPQTMTAQRTAVLTQLVQLAVRYNGVQQESVGSGDYSATSADYQRERERLLSKLAPRGGVFLA